MTVLRRAGPRTLRTYRAVRDELERFLRDHGDRLVERRSSHWIGWRSARFDRVFAEVRAGRDHLEVFLLPPCRALADPRGLAVRPPSTQGWGWFRSKVRTNGGSPRALALLVRQSYLSVRNGRVRRPSRRRG